MRKNKPTKKRKYSKRISRIIGLPLGAIFGYWLSESAMSIFKGIFSAVEIGGRIAISITSSTIFAALFFIVAPYILDAIINFGYLLERKLSRYSSKDIAGGALGLFCGLFFAFLMSNLINLIPIVTIANFLTFVDYVMFGTLGMFLGVRKLKEIVIVHDKLNPSIDILKVIDSSALVDGRIYELAKTGFIEGKLIVPKFILDELRTIADSSDNIKRARGRRGLDIVKLMQEDQSIELVITDDPAITEKDVDSNLLNLAVSLKAKIITLDYNLSKVASVLDIETLNINALSKALKQNVMVGETITVELLKSGKDKTQGVGYLDDGTMVVVENGGEHIGLQVDLTVTSNIQTNAGRMIFGRI